jgi:biopolymer transport protein ExbB
MFSKYAGSKFRMAMLATLLVGVAVGLGRVAMAQAAGGAGAAPPAPTSGLHYLFVTMDIFVLCVLIGCSIGVVALSIDAFMHVRETRIAPVETTEHLRSLINSRQFKELMDFTATDTSFVSQSLNAGLRRAHLGYPAMREATESAIGDQIATWFRRIELLNVIGNIGPLIGLLGTVLGMIMAFQALKEAGGTPKVGELSGGISAALWHTFGGLFVAIPALVVFGFYRTRIDKITSKAALLSEELLESLRPEEKKTSVNVGEVAGMAKPAPRRAATPTQETV